MAIILVHHDKSFPLDKLTEDLNDSENRMGRIVTIKTEGDTLTRHDILADPPGRIALIIAGGAKPAGKALDIAGKAFVAGKIESVEIYR